MVKISLNRKEMTRVINLPLPVILHSHLPWFLSLQEPRLEKGESWQ